MKKSIVTMLLTLLTLAITPPVLADRGWGYSGHHGYRETPYDKHRHYDRYDRRGHDYEYRGHWRSWNDWDHYRRSSPHRFRYGRYYWEGEHLMFRFCDPDNGNCFFFSIGR